MPLRITLRCAVVLLAAAAQPVEAQPTRSDSLPRAFVEALLGSMGGGRDDMVIRAGLLDANLPRAVVRDAVPLGFTSFSSTSMSVAQFAYDEEAAIDSLRARLLREGFREPPAAMGPQRRGLSGSMSYGSLGGRGSRAGFALCGPSTMIRANATGTSAAATTILIVVQYEPRSFAMLCNQSDARERVMFDPMASSPVPELPPPRGMFSAGGGSSGSAEGGGSQRAELEGAVPLPRVQAHYDSLFVAAKWTVVERGSGTSFATTVYEMRIEAGELWRATMTSTALPNSRLVDIELFTRLHRRR